MFWLLRGSKGLLHDAAQKARHAEIAFRDASRAMDGAWHAIRDLSERMDAQAPKALPRDIYKTMRRVERHAKLLRRRTLELRDHMEKLDKQAKGMR